MGERVRAAARTVLTGALSARARTLIRMSPDPADPGSARSAAQWNEAIRNLWFRAGGTLTTAERAEYERLLIEWAAAIKAEIVEAA